MIQVIFDTEFTDIGPGGDLLSIGFAPVENGPTLYIEIIDYEGEPSDWVKENVMPLMGRHQPKCLTREHAAVAIDRYFAELRNGNDEAIRLLSDSCYDWQHLIELFVRVPGSQSWASEMNITGTIINDQLPIQQQALFLSLSEAWFAEYAPTERHHALVDARALRTAWRQLAWAHK